MLQIPTGHLDGQVTICELNGGPATEIAGTYVVMSKGHVLYCISVTDFSRELPLRPIERIVLEALTNRYTAQQRLPLVIVPIRFKSVFFMPKLAHRR